MKYRLGALGQLAFGIGVLCLAAGCSNDPVYATPAMMVPFKNLPVMYAGQDLADTVPLAADGITEKRTDSGQLQLTLNFTNVGKYPENILVKCQFQEQDGSILDNDMKKGIMSVEPQETKPMVFLSNTQKAAKYQVQVLKHNGGPMPDDN